MGGGPLRWSFSSFSFFYFLASKWSKTSRNANKIFFLVDNIQSIFNFPRASANKLISSLKDREDRKFINFSWWNQTKMDHLMDRSSSELAGSGLHPPSVAVTGTRWPRAPSDAKPPGGHTVALRRQCHSVSMSVSQCQCHILTTKTTVLRPEIFYRQRASWWSPVKNITTWIINNIEYFRIDGRPDGGKSEFWCLFVREHDWALPDYLEKIWVLVRGNSILQSGIIR